MTTGTAIEWRLRAYREGDIPALVAVANAAAAAGDIGGMTTDEEMERDLFQPLSDPYTQLLVAEGPRIEGIPDGVPAGYARVVPVEDESTDTRRYQMQMRVHPSAKGYGLERALITRMVEMAREHEASPGVRPMKQILVMAGARASNRATRSAYTGAGLQEVRFGWIMERSLAEPLPEPAEVAGVRVRNYRRPEDNAPCREAYDASFIDHFGYQPFPQEFWDYRMSAPELRPDLSWVAEVVSEPGKLAGFCLCEIRESDNQAAGQQEGWIALLGTVRGWRGLGLGRSLLVRGLVSLREAGMETALLGVDSESPTGANRLYESVGFKVRHLEVACMAPLDSLSI